MQVLIALLSPIGRCVRVRYGRRFRALQGYLAHNAAPPREPTEGLRPGPYGGLRRGGVLVSEVPLYVVHRKRQA